MGVQVINLYLKHYIHALKGQVLLQKHRILNRNRSVVINKIIVEFVEMGGSNSFQIMPQT